MQSIKGETMKVIIDRFEGRATVCEKEDRSMIEVPRIVTPEDAKEGDVLIIENGDIIIDHEATEERRKEIEGHTKGLWKWIITSVLFKISFSWEIDHASLDIKLVNI